MPQLFLVSFETPPHSVSVCVCVCVCLSACVFMLLSVYLRWSPCTDTHKHIHIHMYLSIMYMYILRLHLHQHTALGSIGHKSDLFGQDGLADAQKSSTALTEQAGGAFKGPRARGRGLEAPQTPHGHPKLHSFDPTFTPQCPLLKTSWPLFDLIECLFGGLYK